MNWKDIHTSRRRLGRTVGGYYLLSALLLLVAFVMFSDYEKTGEIIIKGFTYSGNEALYPIGGLLFVSVILFAYASFIGLYDLWHRKSASADEGDLVPEGWICTKCQDTFPGCSVSSINALGAVAILRI